MSKPADPPSRKPLSRDDRREAYPAARYRNKKAPGGPPAANEQQRIMDLVVRRVKAFTLKTAGLTYEQIAQQLGVSKRTAQMDVHEQAGDFDQASAAMLPKFRALEEARLDAALRNVWPILNGQVKGRRLVSTQGKGKARQTVVTEVPADGVRVAELQLGASDRLVRISARRSELLGLNAPLKIAATDPSGTRTYHDMALDDLEKLVRQRASTLGLPDIEVKGKVSGNGSGGNGHR